MISKDEYEMLVKNSYMLIKFFIISIFRVFFVYLGIGVKFKFLFRVFLLIFGLFNIFVLY